MKKNKKISIIINDLSFFYSHRLPIAEELIKKGFEVCIGYGVLGRTDKYFLERKDLKFVSIPMKRGGVNPIKEIQTIINIWKFIKKEKPDLIHLVTIKPYLYGGIVSYLANVPAVISAVSGLGTLFINSDFKSRLLRFLLYPIFKLAFKHNNQKVILQNEDDKKKLVNWGVLNPTKVKLLRGSGVKIKNFTKLEESKDIITVCFLGRLLRDKGVYEFISAARLIKNRGVKARFWLAGDEDIDNPSGLNKKDLKDIKKEGIVEVLGYQKDIPQLYASAHIICLPSYREGLPKSLIEAAAASRAIVTTDVSGCRDAIIPNKTGLLVPLKNYEKLADALQCLIENPKKREAMGKEGRKHAEKEFPIEKIVEGHLEIYQELLN